MIEKSDKNRKERSSEMKKPEKLFQAFLVAGAGLEPTAFGL